MPRGQEPSTDPHKTLGLQPGASMAEVKRAYRLLAKAFHPDSAGEEALPRFLAIHAAYEQLRTGKVVAAQKPRPAPAASAAEPWRADPSRAKAARERARSARTRPGSASGAAGATGTGPSGPTTGGARDGGGTSPSGTPRSGTRSGRRRDQRKATMGSTSYDEARDSNDATWSGASWYGPSSGEYWIVNPREYADPRKHGPEYQQRARRPVDGDTAEAVAAGFEVPRAEGAHAAGARADAPRAEASRPVDREWRTTSGPAATAGGSAPSRAERADEASGSALGSARSSAPPRGRPGEAAPPGDRVEALGAASRAWLGGPTDDPIRRLGLALVAWPPIGLAAAATIGEATGCTTYAAACSGVEPLLPWLAQAAILGLLLLLPPMARLLAGGAIAVLIALVPITVILLSLGGGAATAQAGAALALLLGIAWFVGLGWSARTFRSRSSMAAGS